MSKKRTGAEMCGDENETTLLEQQTVKKKKLVEQTSEDTKPVAEEVPEVERPFSDSSDGDDDEEIGEEEIKAVANALSKSALGGFFLDWVKEKQEKGESLIRQDCIDGSLLGGGSDEDDEYDEEYDEEQSECEEGSSNGASDGSESEDSGSENDEGASTVDNQNAE